MNAAGGSRSQNGAFAQVVFYTVAGASSGSSAPIPNVIQNDYVIVVVGFSGTGQTVKAGGVTDSGSTSFSKTASSSSNQDTEIWCGQYTAASASDTVTVQSTANANYEFAVYFLGGLSSCTADTSQTNHGATAAMSVASFTPTTGDACIGVGSEFAGQGSITYAQVDPFMDDNGGNGIAPATSSNFNTNHYAVTILRGAWNSNDGATTATITPSASTSPTWDEVVSCYPTSSAGNEVYNSGYRGGGRGAQNNPNEGVNGVLKGDYTVQLTAVAGNAFTVSSVTDLNGGGDTFVRAGGSDVHNDVEVWVGKALQTNDVGFQTTSLLTGVASGSVVIGADIGSITSTTAQVFTNSGTSPTISLPSFTPNPYDLCIEDASINTGVGATFSVNANQPFQDIGASVSGGVANLYQVTVMRANWPSGVSSTGTITPSATSSPQWDVVVVCFPGTVVVPLTCTMDNSGAQATVALSESSGNALSPSSALCNGVSHNIVVDPSVTLTATEPADLSLTRDRFSAGSTTTTDNTCAGAASGSCSAWSFTNYEQLLNNYGAAPHLKSWDSGLTITPTGTVAGVVASSVCTISPTGGTSTTAMCTGWADYNRAVTMPSTASGAPASTRWLFQGSPVASTTGGNLYTFNYFDQLQNTYDAHPSAPSTFTGSINFAATGTSYGAGATICTISVPASPGAQDYSCAGYSDYDTAVTLPTTSGNNPANVRWETGGTTVFTDTTGGNTHTVNYREQLLNTFQASPTSPSTWDATGPSVNAHGITNCASTSPCQSAAFSTSITNDVIVVMVGGGSFSLPTVSISDSAGLTWHNRISSGCSWSNQYHVGCEYWALASSTLSNDQITITFSNCGGPCSAFGYGVMAISGANTATPFDPNAAVPAVNTNEAPLTSGVVACTMSTNNANDLLIGFNSWNYGTAETLPTGWSPLDSVTTSFTSVDAYDFVASTLSSQVQTWVGVVDGYQTLICDAIQDNIGPVAVTGTLLGTPGQTICVMPGPNPGTSTVLSCSYWADYNLPVTMGYLTVSANERWAPLTPTYTDTTGGNTHTDSYYEQLQNTYQAGPTSPRTWDAALSIPVTGTQFGSAVTLCTISTSNGGGTVSCQAYSDYNTLVTVTSPLVVSANEMWSASTTNTFTDTTGGNTHLVTYVDQYSMAVSDTFTFSDSVSRSLALPRQAADAFAVSDVPARQVVLGRQLSDSVSYTDLAARSLSLTQGVTDLFSFTDSSARQVLLARLASDTLSIVDGTTRQLALARTGADSWGSSESSLVMTTISRGAADMVSYTESVSRLVTFTRAVSDAISTAELALSQSVFSRGASDTLSYLEGAAGMLTFSRTTTDAFAFAEIPSAVESIVRGISDSYLFAEQVTVTTIMSRAAGDLYSFSDSITRGLGLQGAVSDLYGFMDASQTLVNLSRGAADAFVVSDLASRVVDSLRNVADSFVFSDMFSRSLQLFQSIADSFPFVDGLNHGTLLLRDLTVYVTDNYAFSDTASRFALLTRMVSDAYGFLDGVVRGLTILRTALDGFTAHEATTRLVSLFAIISDTITGLVHSVETILTNVLAGSTGSVTSSSSSSVVSSTSSSLSSGSTSASSTSSSTSSSGSGSSGGFPMAEAILMPIALVAALFLILFARRRKRKDEEKGQGTYGSKHQPRT